MGPLSGARSCQRCRKKKHAGVNNTMQDAIKTIPRQDESNNIRGYLQQNRKDNIIIHKTRRGQITQERR